MRVISVIFLIGFVFSISISAQPEAVQTFFRQGTQAAQVQNYQSALELYQRSLAFSAADDNSHIKPFLSKIHYNIGVCYYQLNRPAEAVAEFTKAIDLGNKNYQKAFYGLGMAQIGLKNWAQAKEAFLNSIRLNGRDGEVWFDLAMILVREKDYEAAQVSFLQAVKYDSISKSAGHNNIGVISALNGDFQSAAKEFKLALLESDGKLIEAARNLRLCQSYSPDQNANLLAIFEFSGKNKINN